MAVKVTCLVWFVIGSIKVNNALLTAGINKQPTLLVKDKFSHSCRLLFPADTALKNVYQLIKRKDCNCLSNVHCKLSPLSRKVCAFSNQKLEISPLLQQFALLKKQGQGTRLDRTVLATYYFALFSNLGNSHYKP